MAVWGFIPFRCKVHFSFTRRISSSESEGTLARPCWGLSLQTAKHCLEKYWKLHPQHSSNNNWQIFNWQAACSQTANGANLIPANVSGCTIVWSTFQEACRQTYFPFYIVHLPGHGEIQWMCQYNRMKLPSLWERDKEKIWEMTEIVSSQITTVQQCVLAWGRR